MGAARAVAAATAAAALLALACASATGQRGPPPPDPDLRIWAPPVVHWSGAERSLRFAIENATQRTLEIKDPHPSGARVEIFADSDAPRSCGVEPREPPAEEAVKLEPGDQVPVTVDLAEACRDLRPGEYRFEVSYRIPGNGGGGIVLHTRYGTLVVEGSPRAARRSPGPVRPATPRAAD